MKPTERLPIEEYKDIIKQAVAQHDVVVITAETGAGKSTQVPQYLMEAGHQVVVTQPRRLAARTVAARVAEELSYREGQAGQVGKTRGELGDVVGYRTAFERKDSPDNKILFCTDGLQMVRELMGSQKTDVLIIDEVHEWNINIETLVAWTRQQISEGRKMKLVLMSATMEAEKLAKYYGEDTPVISVPGRLYPVSEDQVGPREMIGKIKELVKKGRNVLVFQPGKKEIASTIEDLQKSGLDAEILPLHGELTPDEQKRCFRSYNKPKVVVSTNVAQTSVTIPDIDAVVDSGMERRVELKDGIEGLYLKPISNADRKQRKGRAGRVKEGEYILAAEEGATDRPDFPKAEIERSRLDQLVLRLAAIGFDATELEFFHQPDKKVLAEAKRALHALGAMDESGQVTKVGRLMSKLPLSVQYSRMLIEAQKHGVTDDVLTLVSILEVGGLRAKGDAWKTYTQETESDLLAELDLWKAAQGKRNGELQEMGIFAKSYFRAKELRKKLEDEVRRHQLKPGSSGNRQDILKACVSGMVDHLYRYDNYYGNYRNGDNSSRELGRESAISGRPEWIVGQPKDIQFKNRKGRLCTLNLVSMATRVDPQWLLEVAPQLASEKQENYKWDNEKGEAVAEEVILFNGNEVGRKRGVSALPCEQAYRAMAHALTRDAEQFPPAIAEACKKNNGVMERSTNLYLRCRGEVKSIPQEDLQAHYAAALEVHGMLTKTALQTAIDSGEFAVADMEMNLERYISAEKQACIEAENPLEIEIADNRFAIQYTHDWNGFKSTVEMTLEELSALSADASLEIPSQRQLTLKISDAGYTSLSAHSVGELKQKVEDCRLEQAWKAFREANTGESQTLEETTRFPALPDPIIYDEATGAMAYPGIYIYYGSYQISWFKDQEAASRSQEDAEARVNELKRSADEERNYDQYVAEAKVVAEELTALIKKIDDESLHEDYGFKSTYDSAFNTLTGYDFRCTVNRISSEPLKVKEQLLAIKKEFETGFETAKQAKAAAEAEQARIDQLVEAGEVLVDFGGHFRTMGATNQAEYWVIQADGTLREADEIEYRRRYTDEGDKRWKLVNPDELAMSWFKDCTAAPHEFRFDKQPVNQCTEEQRATIVRIKQEIAERFEGATGISGQVSPSIDDTSFSTESASQPIYSDSPEISVEPEKPASLADLMGKFGKANESKPEEKPKPAPATLQPQEPAKPAAPEEPAFTPLPEMSEEAIFEEYEANEATIQALLTENRELEMVFELLERSRTDLAEAEMKLEKTLARRDRADTLTGKKAKQEKEKLKAAAENLREERKAFKLRVQDIEKKSHCMQEAKNRLDALRARQAQIEEIL